MKRSIIAVAAVLALPGTALAQDPTAPDAEKNAAKVCKAEREALGKTTFRATYGTNKKRTNAFGKCVSKQTKAEEAHAENAAQACKAEREADEAAFTEKYGTGKKGKNAFGKCVSAKDEAASEADIEDTVDAAKTCKAERNADPDAFKEKYGTNESKRNAFGKCVSKTVAEQDDAEETAAKS